MVKFYNSANLSKIVLLKTLSIIFLSALSPISANANLTKKIDLSIPSTYSIGENKWFDTGIDINKNSQLLINSYGKWRLGSGQRECDANGLSNFPPFNGNLYGTLMGKIGQSGAVFPIGKKYSSDANSTGRLFLGNNDSNSVDNSGQINVSIEIKDTFTINNNMVELSVPSSFSIGENKWFDSGINIKKGSTLSIKSHGTWRLGSGPRECNANGLPNFPPYNGNLYGTLMGKIGINGVSFQIGTEYQGYVTSSGRLFLGNNDSNSADNSGNILVSIMVK